MKKKKKYIKIFALSLLFMISISVNAEVKAETNYFDDNDVMYRLIFDDTNLKNFVQRDFALYYNERDMQNEEIAKLTSENNANRYSLGFAKNKELKIVIYKTSEEWQQNNNEKYIVSVIPDYSAGSQDTIYPSINDDIIIKKNKENGNYYFMGTRWIWYGGFNLNYLNFSKNINGVNSFREATITNLTGNGDLVIIVNKDGTIKRYTDIENNNNSLYQEIQTNAKYNIIYSSIDIYDLGTGQIIRPKDEVRKQIRIEKDIKVNQDESNEINFKIYNLKKDDKIKIIKKDKSGNYTENDIIEKTITINLNENQSYLIKDENIKENKIYDIKVYNNKNEEIYSEEYIHTMKNYVLEDTTEEKNKLINLEDYKINNKVANLIKNIFIIGNEEYLGKIIFLVFTITIITIIRKMV